MTRQGVPADRSRAAPNYARLADDPLRFVLDQVSVVVWTTDRDLVITSSGGGGQARIGSGPNKNVGRTVADLLGVDPQSDPVRVHEQALAGFAGFYVVELAGRTFESHVGPFRDETGTVVGTLGLAMDVTDRRLAEERLREVEFRYQQLVERAPAVIYVDSLDGASTTVYVSPQTVDVFGYSPEQWLGDPGLWERILHPEDRDREVKASLHHHETGEPYRADYRVFTRDGQMKWIRDEASVLRDDHGRPQFCHGIMLDITERKLAEQALADALEGQREAAAQLRILDEMKNTFLSAVSHELRTPLTTILGSALTLDRDDTEVSSSDARDLIKRLAANARKLDRLLSDLLDLDRLARGIVEPNRRRVDIGALVRSLVEDADYLAGRSVTVDAPPVIVAIDPPKVERIVENLMVNSIRHTPADVPIWVRVRVEEAGVLLVVEDAGPGVPPEYRDAIFEPFHQGPGGSDPRPGVGIGLSLVARFAQLHGGRAWVEERPGGGSSFKVLLPDAEPSHWSG